MGTGGYQLTSYEPGVRTLAKRFPNYYKENRAHFDEIEIIIMPDVNARTVALKTGQVDVINRPDRKTAHLLGQSTETATGQRAGWSPVHVSDALRHTAL